MFEEAHLLGPTERSIIVQTRQGRAIQNRIALEPGEREFKKYQAIFRRFALGWQERKPPCGVYNCAGHVWASRRTAIDQDSEWHMILADDGYRMVENAEVPSPGDLVVYRDPDVGFLHVGMVLVLQPVAGSSLKISWVLSKWDDASGEVLHNFQDHPFGIQGQGLTVIIEFWTDRPQSSRRSKS